MLSFNFGYSTHTYRIYRCPLIFWYSRLNGDKKYVYKIKNEEINTFSFHPVKNITTGEGGAITTNNPEYAEKIKKLRHHNIQRVDPNNLWQYEINGLGYNYRISDIQCALGLSQIKKLKKFVKKRSSLVSLYNKEFVSLSPYIACPVIERNTDSSEIAWHIYSGLFDFEHLKLDRNQAIRELAKAGVYTQVHYIPVHNQPYYKKLYGEKSLPGSEEYFKKTLSLPLFTKMKKSDVSFVVNEIRRILL